MFVFLDFAGGWILLRQQHVGAAVLGPAIPRDSSIRGFVFQLSKLHSPGVAAGG